MTRTEEKKLIVTLAQAFSAKLRTRLKDRRMVEVVRRNRQGEDDVCASHDFCDANMVMASAFRKVTGREMDLSNDDHIFLWNEAHDLAKKNEFYLPQTLLRQASKPR